MGDLPRPNYDRPVIYEPQEMKDPDEEKDAARDDQVQLLAHCLPPIYGKRQVFCVNPVLHLSSFTQTVAKISYRIKANGGLPPLNLPPLK
jgi:hypothetical protein